MNKVYKATVTMTPDKFEHINGLLSITVFGEDLELDAKFDAKRNENRLICKADFGNNVLLHLYLCSGSCNYFLDPIFFVKGLGEVGSDEAGFELSEDNTKRANRKGA